MAKDITLLGASYPSVPGVVLPQTGGGTATFLDTDYPRGTNVIAPERVLFGYKGYVNGAEVTGSITSQGAQTITPGTTDQTIASGKYLSGTQTILGDADLVSGNIRAGVNIFGVQGATNVIDTTIPYEDVDFPITSASVRDGFAGFVDGQRVNGSMPYNVPTTSDITTVAQQHTIPLGYHDGNGKVQISSAEQAKIIPGNIKSGVEVLGVTGTYSGSGLATAVTGTFTPGTAGAVESVTIPYSGSGYPIVCTVFPADGSYKSSTPIYNLVQRYVVVEWFMTKGNTAVSPTYTTSGGANYGCTAWVYKSDTSSATTYSRSSGMTTNTFSSSDPTAAGATVVRFSGNKTMKYMVANTSYGLAKDVEYRYVILYSA